MAKKKPFCCRTNVGNSKQARWARLPCLGSQSKQLASLQIQPYNKNRYCSLKIPTLLYRMYVPQFFQDIDGHTSLLN